MNEDIDWARLRARILETPIVVKPKYIKHPNRSPESIEKRRENARLRGKKWYWSHLEEARERNKRWRKENPDKVKAKKKRFYEKHKTDPEWLEKKRAKQREYKRRKKIEKQNAIINQTLEMDINNELKNETL